MKFNHGMVAVAVVVVTCSRQQVTPWRSRTR
jgi:hypothetical protein